MTVNKQGFVLAEITLVLLFVSITCCSLLAAYQGCVRLMQQHNRQAAALELLSAVDQGQADAAAAARGWQIKREEVAAGAGRRLRQEIVSVTDGKTNRIIFNQVRYAALE